MVAKLKFQFNWLYILNKKSRELLSVVFCLFLQFSVFDKSFEKKLRHENIKLIDDFLHPIHAVG